MSSGKVKIYPYKNIRGIVTRLRDDLNNGGSNFILLYAYNGTGKTRLSMEFKEAGKRKKGVEKDTLYFNAYTEDLFYWDNDLNNDTERVLKINSDSKFFSYLERYAEFDFKIDYEKWTIIFKREIKKEDNTEIIEHIKVSRGEETIFIWCIFLAICELTLDGAEGYNWVKYFYIDDPISSLDDNNAIAVASDLAQLLKRGTNHVKTVISSHHSLFFNVMCNELKKTSHKVYFLHRNKNDSSYTLRATDDTPFFHHVSMLSELQKASESGKLYTYHFNMLRSILEKTATFFGFDDFSKCIHGVEDEILFTRALNLLSHGK
jgi:AAA domain